MTRAFHVQIIKPAHYDDEGYVIQWWKASIQSNSLASLYAIVQDAADRQVLSRNVTLTSNGWDECNTVISEDRIAKRIPSAGAGVVFLVGVQTNQFARALDMARGFRACRLPRILYSHAATGIGRPPEAGPAGFWSGASTGSGDLFSASMLSAVTPTWQSPSSRRSRRISWN